MYTEISKDNNLHIFIQVDGNVEEYSTYRLNAFFFNNTNVSRLSLNINNNKLTANNTSKQSITNLDNAKLDINGNTIHITLPSSVTGDYQKIFINAQTFVGNTMLDRTAWRMLER